MVILERLPSATHPQVVRVRVSVEEPDFDAPWLRTPHEREGIAVVIGPRLLLTLASVVTDAVEPARPVGANQVLARIAAIDHDRDLALLEVTDSASAAWDIEPVALGTLAVEGQVVVLVGASEDPPRIDVGTGRIVSIGLHRYSHSMRHLLAVTLDARQPFHVGGDAVFGQSGLVGIVMQRHPDDELRGELIPAPIIRAFLEGVAARKPPGVPALGISVQSLTNPLMRAQYGDQGVLVSRVDLGSTCDGVLEPRDVLLSIGGVPIADDGSVAYEGHELRHYVVLSTTHLGDPVELGIRRAGVSSIVTATLRPWLPLVPPARPDASVRYFVYGGLVFQPLTRDYLTTWESWFDKAPKELLHAYYMGRRTEGQLELVVMTSVLADPINAGYELYANESIIRVGERVPRDLDDLVSLIEAAHGTVTLETSSGGLLALDTQEVRQATPRIVRANAVPRDRT